MPRFLNTSTGEFESHNDPTRIVYAILSHTWRLDAEGGEQSYQDVCALQAQAAVADDFRKQQAIAVVDELKALGAPVTPDTLKPSLIPRVPKSPAYSASTSSQCVLNHPKLSDKIKGVCKVAREAGIRLVWNDACCIDKSSSAELSEAINSMYELYRLSQVCYVYLEDVPDGDDPRDQHSRFWKSKWHKRGWTLQELIAPETVEFLTKTWRLLGTKIGLSATLEEITGVDFKILTGQAAVGSASVARRMSWAAGRKTTRIEDEAYCLLGIFGIHMSPIYGEGNNAFFRLQEEIVRTTPDQSIFAWGIGHIPRRLSTRDVDKASAFEYKRLFFSSDPGLVASRAGYFEGYADITPITPSTLASRLQLNRREVPSVHCVFTPQGVRMQLLSLRIASTPVPRKGFHGCIGYSDSRPSCPDCMRNEAEDLALLQCEDESGSLIALPLCRPQEDIAESGRGLFIGTHIACARSLEYRNVIGIGGHNPYRTVRLTRVALAKLLEHVTPTLIEVFILRHHPKPPSAKMLPLLAYRRSSSQGIEWPLRVDDSEDALKSVTFRIPPRDIEALGLLGFVAESPFQVLCVEKDKEVTVRTTLAFNGGSLSVPSRGNECPQVIELTLALKKPSGDQSPYYQLVRFSIANSIGVLAGDESGISTSPLVTAGGVNGTSHVMRPAPCVDGTGDHSLLEDFGAEASGRKYVDDRIVANAEFTVYSDADWQKDACTIRFLRVSLWNPLGCTHKVTADRILWLSVQVSEKYRYTRCIVDMTLRPDDLPPLQDDDIAEHTTTNEYSSDDDDDISERSAPSQSSSGDSSKETEALGAVSSSAGRVTSAIMSVTGSEHPEDSVSSCASTQAPLSEELPTSQVGGLLRCTPLYRHGPERNVHDDVTTEASGIAIPCAMRSMTTSERRVMSEPGGESPPSAFPLPSSSSTQPEGVRELVSEDIDTTHEARECSDGCRGGENDALRAQVATLDAQIADLMSKNVEMSSQMADIHSRRDAPSASRAIRTNRQEPSSRQDRRKGRCVIQ